MKPLHANLLALAATSLLYVAVACSQAKSVHAQRTDIPNLSGAELRDALETIAAAEPGSARRQELADQLCRRVLGPGVVAFFTTGGSLVCRPPALPRKDLQA